MTRKKLYNLAAEIKVKQVGSNVRYIRNLRGMTMEQFAKKLGVTKQCVSMYECGNGVSLGTLLALCDALDVTPNVLLGYDKRISEFIDEIESIENKYRNIDWGKE